jgi:hypothetical protein
MGGSIIVWPILADTVDGRWQPGIGDPTPVGWLTVAWYFAAALGCFLAAWREPGTYPELGRKRGPDPFWLALGVTMALLGVNKQLDLQSLFTQIARDWAQSQGWYERRHEYQRTFIVIVTCVAACLLGVFAWFGRRRLVRRGLAILGTTFVFGFVVARASSFHAMDQFITSRIGTWRWNWVLELGGIAIVMAGTWLATRPPRTRVSQLEPRGDHVTYRYRVD